MIASYPCRASPDAMPLARSILNTDLAHRGCLRDFGLRFGKNVPLPAKTGASVPEREDMVAQRAFLGLGALDALQTVHVR
jgi:hypothetical protein